MSAPTVRQLLRSIREPLVWLLAFSIVAYGQSATLVRLLGPAHRHQAVSAEVPPGLLERIDSVFHDIRVWRAELHDRLLPEESQAHVHADGVVHVHARGDVDMPSNLHAHVHSHAHAGYERHFHAAGDGSVVSIDAAGGAAADASADAAAGSAALPLALAPRLDWATLNPGASRWPMEPPGRWDDAAARQAERPPSHA